MAKRNIPYQSNNEPFFIRKIRKTFDAASIDEQPHRHEFYELLYIKNGTGQHEIDAKIFDLNARTFYLISKGQVHNFLFAENVEGYLIRFKDVILPTIQSAKEGFYHNLLFALRQFPDIQIGLEDQLLVEMLLQRMQEEYEKENFDLHFIRHLLYPMLVLLNRYIEGSTEEQDHKQDFYLQFIKLLESSFKESHDLQFYAQSLGLSKRKLSEICKEKSGKSTKKIINDRLMAEAKRLIKYTSLPLKEITNQLGFKDVGYFCRYFKKVTKLTPSEYKNLKK